MVPLLTRVLAVAALGLAGFGAAGCASVPTPALVAEVGDSFARFRKGFGRATRPTPGLEQTLSPHQLLGRMRDSLVQAPGKFRIHTMFLPDPSDLGRLLAPPNAGWQPAGLSQRFVSRYRF